MSKNRPLIIVAGVVVLLLLIWFIWPSGGEEVIETDEAVEVEPAAPAEEPVNE